MLSPLQLAQLDACAAAGGIALFGADTVYGLACDAGTPAALARIKALKARPESRPAAVMFFDRDAALDAVGEVGERTHDALAALLPGPVTVLLPNPRGLFPLAGGSALGLRVPLPGRAAVHRAFLQTSANPSGGTEASSLAGVAQQIRDGVDLALDSGELAGVASSVVDLTQFEETRAWSVVREGAMATADIARLLQC
jgi:L-threonylcarbamoyladenylate synthase